jgi:hypothetical protein
MSTCVINTSWQYKGLEVVRLENEILAVEILPQVGAKIYSFVHKPSGTHLLWHNPRLAPAAPHYGAKFDDTWSGGWDELVPNDLPFPFPNGDLLPDHGEVWSQAAEWRVTAQGADAVSVAFVHHGRVLPTRFEKHITLRAGESMLRVRYKYLNQGPRPIDFLWNVHPALAVSSATRLDVPAGKGIVEAWMNEQFEAGLEYEWPLAPDRKGKLIDLRIVPAPAEAVGDHHYLPDVREGWYAATDAERRTGFGLVFPTSVFPHLWMFRTLGGWRGLNTLILEISNGYPNNLRKAIDGGHCGTLAPGQAVEPEVIAVAYAGITGVERIEPNGRVIPRA